MKKTFFIVSILLIFIAGYFYVKKPQPLQSKGAEGLQIARISDSTLELRGDLVFHNPNTMRAQLGKVDVDIYVEGTSVAVIHDEFKTAVKGGENCHFSFQVRFPHYLAVHDGASLKELHVGINGRAASDALFANYSFPVDFSGSVKNPY